jgi:hypothetical protein
MKPDLFGDRNHSHIKLRGPIFSEEDCKRLCAFYALMKKSRGMIKQPDGTETLKNFDFWLCVRSCSGDLIEPHEKAEQDPDVIV